MSTTGYAIKDRDGTIHPESSKKEAQRAKRAYGGMVMRSRTSGNDQTWKPWKRHHVFLWVFLAIQVAFLAWLISGASTGGGINASVVAQCHTQAVGMGMTQAQCVSFLGGASKAGTAIGVGLMVVVWVVVDFLVGLTYGIYRLARR